MDNPSGSRTSPTLLGRLRQEPADQDAWARFVERYGPHIYGWCRRGGLQEADAEDVTQMVLTQLARQMRGFDYDPSRSFRGWLRTLTRHAWSDFVSDRQRGVSGSGDSVTLTALHSVEARDDLEKRLEDLFDLELLAFATGRVQQRVEPRTWEAYRLTALEGLSGAEAAARLGMQVAAVFKAKSNVQKLLQQEIQDLEKQQST